MTDAALPAAVQARLATHTYTDTYDPDTEQAALRAEAVRRAWAAQVDPRFADATLAGMYEAEQKAVVRWRDDRDTGDLLLWSMHPGGGKTHTAYALLNKAVDKGLRVYATTADAMMNALTDQDARWQRAELLREYLNADILLVDELGKVSRPNWMVGEMWQVLNRRYTAGKRTIYTSNASPDMLEEAYVSLFSRIREGGTILEITYPDRRVAAETFTRRGQ